MSSAIFLRYSHSMRALLFVQRTHLAIVSFLPQILPRAQVFKFYVFKMKGHA